MSKSLTTAQVQSFDDLVKQSYQGVGLLRPTVRVKTGVVGNTHRFTKIGLISRSKSMSLRAERFIRSVPAERFTRSAPELISASATNIAYNPQ